ncbi:MAG: hypothetical protein GY874_20345 [Desulfobacteraceae bacterium]|nr:hypothetical protein [Desulfobacteraceae bacterium]
MYRIKLVVLSLITLLIMTACGPDTVRLRQSLDSPLQHVSNGHNLLDRGKIDHACREFRRAMDLDPNYLSAYVGLAIALAYKGEIKDSMKNLEHAKSMANSPKEHKIVKEGIDRIAQITDQRTP